MSSRSHASNLVYAKQTRQGKPTLKILSSLWGDVFSFALGILFGTLSDLARKG